MSPEESSVDPVEEVRETLTNYASLYMAIWELDPINDTNDVIKLTRDFLTARIGEIEQDAGLTNKKPSKKKLEAMKQATHDSEVISGVLSTESIDSLVVIRGVNRYRETLSGIQQVDLRAFLDSMNPRDVSDKLSGEDQARFQKWMQAGGQMSQSMIDTYGLDIEQINDPEIAVLMYGFKELVDKWQRPQIFMMLFNGVTGYGSAYAFLQENRDNMPNIEYVRPAEPEEDRQGIDMVFESETGDITGVAQIKTDSNLDAPILIFDLNSDQGLTEAEAHIKPHERKSFDEFRRYASQNGWHTVYWIVTKPPVLR